MNARLRLTVECKEIIIVVAEACGYGGIGRHAGFRFQWATVQVRILLPAFANFEKGSALEALPFLFFNFTLFLFHAMIKVLCKKEVKIL